MGVVINNRGLGAKVKYFDARISPNPLQGRANIDLQLPQDGRVGISAFNLLGQQVMFRDLGWFKAGRARIAWPFGENLKPGVYFLAVTLNENNRIVRKVLAVQ